MQRDLDVDQFVRLLTDSQAALYAYIRTLVPDASLARDALQETNAVLWKKAEEFEPGTNFSAWAYKTARFKALGALRDQRRDRHVFDDSIVERLADAAQRRVDGDDRRTLALEACLDSLSDRQREMIVERYTPGGSVTEMANRLGRPAGSISVALNRIRRGLIDCIRRRMEGFSG
jgi:RNA polymerase sigma-70 factor (ECF subfamily)